MTKNLTEIKVEADAGATLQIDQIRKLVADAVTSRTQANWRLAMDYLRQAGAVVTTTETALFQLLGHADADAFRELARLIR